MNRNRRRCLIQATGLMAGTGPWPARAVLPAPSWPSAPIRILLVYPPGGVSDVAARLLAEQLSMALATPVRVEYRPGASGSLGLEALAGAAADGHTLAFSALSPLTLYPQLARVRYDPLRDFAPVASVMLTPSLLVATKAFGGRSIADLLAAARAAPGRLRWATTGAGTTGHLVLVQWQRASGASVNHIPYKGGGQQVADALAGQFELLSTNVGGLQLQHLRSGSLRALAVGAPLRLAALPQVPTWAELGYPAANLASLFGLLAPAGTPASVITRLNAEVQRALAAPALRDPLLAAHNLPTGGSADDFVRQIRQEITQHAALLRQAPITLD